MSEALLSILITIGCLIIIVLILMAFYWFKERRLDKEADEQFKTLCRRLSENNRMIDEAMARGDDHEVARLINRIKYF